MRRELIAVLIVLGAAGAFARTARADTVAPLPVADAERVVAEERDFLTDFLWVGMDGCWHEGDWESCLRLCREIILLEPHFVDAYTGGAWVLWSNDRDKEAEALYQQGIAANPGDPDLYFECGFFYRERKQYDKAVAMFRLVVKYGGTKPQQRMLPNTLEEAGRKQEALAEWRKLSQRFPEDIIAKNKIARLERELYPRPPTQKP